MTRKTPPSAVWLAALACGAPFSIAAVTDLSVTKSGADVVLTWTTGTQPYQALRSRTSTFISGNKTVAQGLTTGSAIDVGAAVTGDTYFYLALDSSEAPPPTFNLNPPRPVPAITNLSPDNGQPGATVTISGTSFAYAGSGTVVMFGDVPASIQSATTTSIVVVVPVGAVTSDVRVCVVEECSNSSRFTVPLGPAFQDLSSIAFESATGSLWLGDRGTGDQVVELTSDGTANNRAAQNEAFVSNVSPSGTGAGRIYFSNGVVNTANQGTIRYIKSDDNSKQLLPRCRYCNDGSGVGARSRRPR